MKSSVPESRFSIEVALQVAGLAGTLHERLERAVAEPAQASFTDGRLDVWRRNASAGDEQAFRRRLAWDGLSEERARGALAPGHACATLPGWAQFLAALELGPHPAATCARHPEAFADVAFAPFFQPFIEEASRRLQREASAILTLLSPEAFRALHRHLLSGLSHLAAPVVFQSFAAVRSAATTPSLDGCFRRFIENLLEPAPFQNFFLTYPVLARLLCQHSLAWVETSRELLERLSQDHARINSHFARPGSSLGQVEHLDLGLSDRHHGGRQVAVLTFAEGLRLVYKPKDVSLEQAYNDVLRWLDTQEVPDVPPALQVLDRDRYGWVEFAAPAPLASPEAVKVYYRQAGALLCLIYGLEGSDCHMDNVIATARGPVLVDAEALLQPRLKPWADHDAANAFNLASMQLNASVLNTGLLPLWQRGRRGELHDVGGLGGRGGYESGYQQIVWEHVNTDQMRPRQQFEKEPPGRNVVQLAGSDQDPADYLAELVAGFTGLYRFLLDHQATFLQEAFSRMKGCTARLIFRPSQHYALLLREARRVRQLQDGIEHSLVFERLCGAFARAVQRPYLWPLCRLEQQALENRDVPFFSMATDGVDLALTGGGTIHSCCERSSWDSSRNLFLQFSPTGMQQQIEFIRAAFIPPSIEPEPAQTGPPDAVEKALQTIQPLTSDAFIMAAVAIGKEIAGRAIPGKDGVATWLSPVQWQPDVLGQRGHSYYLYDGACGIALFLAALCKATGDRQLVPLIGAACRPIAAIACHPHANALLADEGIGGASGLGSIVYALVTMHGLLDDASFLEVAGRAARFITQDKIMADQVLDVHGGSAGAILSLLALHRAAPDPEVLRRAERCGDHLLLKRVPGPRGGMAWKAQPEGTLLAGFAHGAAGIACALARLHQATGREDFLEAAHEAVAYERTLFDASARNWPVLNPPGTDVPPRFVNAWCHGAPGIVLGYLACLPMMDTPSLRAEIDTGLDTTVRGGITTLDHLCCGNMGRIEVALAAGEQLDSKRLRTIAAVGATAVVHRAMRAGAYTLQTRPEQNACFQPGFFRGLSGIGYGLLRLAQPKALPCVLNFSTLP